MVSDSLHAMGLTEEEIEQIKNEIPTEPTEREKYLDYIRMITIKERAALMEDLL